MMEELNNSHSFSQVKRLSDAEDEDGVQNPDLEEFFNGLSEQIRSAGDEFKLTDNDERRSPLYQVLESGISSFKKLFTQSEESALQTLVRETASVTSTPCLQRSRADLWSRTICTCCSGVKLPVTQDASEWKIIEPEAMASSVHNNVEYRIAVAPGSYECRYTGLCWESSSEVELKYHLRDWEYVGEFLEKSTFQPCGPLMDITVLSGELTAVHLPHFLCSGSLPNLKDAVRVLHVEDSGVSLERCELSCFSAQLLHPTFSPKGVLVRSGFPVKAHCEVLIYCTSTAHLTLHVYLVPCDSKTIKSVQKQENGSIKIIKPRPDMSLQMKNRYMLSTSCPSQINPKMLKLKSTSQTPNFFEVYIKDAKDDFQLLLMTEEEESVWEVDIRPGEYSQNHSYVGIHFVDLHRNSFIQRVKLVEPIADDLYHQISDEKYSTITKAKTSQDKMRAIYEILLSGGQTLKAVFLQSLQRHEPHLVDELSQS